MAGPYRSGTGDDPDKLTANVRAMNNAALEVFRAGQLPVTGEALARSTALALVDEIPPGHTGTFVTHSPPVAAALARRPRLEVIVIGGTLDPRALVATGAQTLDGYAWITADVLFLGIWSVHAEHGISGGYHEESEIRRALCCGAPTGSSAWPRARSSGRSRRSPWDPRRR